MTSSFQISIVSSSASWTTVEFEVFNFIDKSVPVLVFVVAVEIDNDTGRLSCFDREIELSCEDFVELIIEG